MANRFQKRRPSAEYEKYWVHEWKKNHTFERSIESRDAKNSYVFYDGPPFITGSPHHGTLLSSIVKDAVPRFWTMQGKRVERRWGWDCHGLPAENFVEQQLGITDRRQIGSEISLEDYVIKARESMVVNAESWQSIVDRIGRWVDFGNAYKTMDKDFMESVWWAFKTLYDKGLIYEGEKVLMYDTHFATVVAKAEVTMDNDAYQTVTDPSAYVKFKLKGEDKYLLAWTTTPWTLPANMALAVNPDLEYVEIDLDGQTLIMAKSQAQNLALRGAAEAGKPSVRHGCPVATGADDAVREELVLRERTGKDLVGLEYHDLFDDTIHQVYAADFVSSDSGTGIVHVAPAYGEDDFKLAEAREIPVKHVVDDNGYYFSEIADQLRAIGVRNTDQSGIEIWAANKFIAKCLEEQGIVWKIDYIRHEYPFNPRSKQRIIYRAIPSWFMDIQDGKSELLAQNENINWVPDHLKHGRFAKNIEQAPDWTLSRNRFWATAMPVWKGDKGTVKVIGSYAELAELTKSKENPDGIHLDDYHRPWVDAIEFDIDGEHFTRIPEVLDCWFESGSMTFAQLHYPFENKEKFEQNYPADFIVEYIGQVRAWFYYVHVINTALFGREAFKNVITTGVVAGNDGRKMSKSLGNFTDPAIMVDTYSADALRFLLLSSPLLSGEDFSLVDKDVSDVQRKLNMIWNIYDFFALYANVDDWKPDANAPPSLENPLDLWIFTREHELRDNITKHMESYNIPEALSYVIPFLDDASNWFVRRSRRRFWKSENDADKHDAYSTLFYILVRLCILLAPFTPFLAEELWHKLGYELDTTDSIHLEDWPEGCDAEPDQEVLDDMAAARAIIEQALALRAELNDGFGQIKIRQPLASLTYGGPKLDQFYEQVIMDETNVKNIIHAADKNVSIDKQLTDALKREGQMRELIRAIQGLRKQSGLEVDDHIKLSIIGLDLAPDLLDILKRETLTDEITTNNYAHDALVKLDDDNITISLERV